MSSQSQSKPLKSGGTPAPEDGRSGGWFEAPYTGAIVLASGLVFKGYGAGAIGEACGEVCFNTALTGYQEILTDPSYADQIVTFTFPHIGNAGANNQDSETANLAASSGVAGCVLRAPITAPSNYRSTQPLDRWLAARNIVGVSGVDTRALTTLIREEGMPNAVIAHNPDGEFDFDALVERARGWRGIPGIDLTRDITTAQSYGWNEGVWSWPDGFMQPGEGKFHVVAIDYGLKRNILRSLASAGCRVTVLPATTTAPDILARKPDGVFLSNGPGDPAATADYAVPIIKQIVNSGTPVFGICLGHQLLGLAAGGRTSKMPHGHHGSNHPVLDVTTGKVEIVSMNHGFAVEKASLPAKVEETHVSLFDGTNCGLRFKDRPAFSVQYHPEASPGPQDSHYLFERFTALMENAGSLYPKT